MNYKLLVSFLAFSVFSQIQAQLYINEVSQGTGNKEYVELIVAGTPTCGDSTVNLQGWILDDNCGFFGNNGIAGGHIKFANNPQWASIKYGTIITIFRGDDIFPGIVADETDANNDNVYVLPSSSNFFDRNVNIPSGGSSSAITTYTTTGYLSGGGSWVMLGMANGSDAFQTVSPTDLTTAFHSVGWGSGISGTDIHFTGSASGFSFVNLNLIDNNPANQANWVAVNATAQGTPAAANSVVNGTWISGLLASAIAGGTTTFVIDTTICFGDSLFVQNTWQTVSGTYYDTILATGGGASSTDTIYTEDFDGINTWTLNTTIDAALGNNGADPNFWTISDSEAGVLPPNCGTSNTGNKSLHITSVFFPNGGAAYDAGGLCGLLFCPETNTDAFSPDISTIGYSNIVLSFDYIANGNLLLDNASVYYSSDGGTTWAVVDNSIKSNVCGTGQGQWTAASYNLPANAENIANLKIRFNWVNNDDGAGTDPSVAINDVRIVGQTPSSGGGCDTIIQTNLTVLNTPTEIADNYMGCDSVVRNGISYSNNTNFFADSTYNAGGCLIAYNNVNIEIQNTVFTNSSATICSTDSIFLAGVWQNTTGTYLDTLQVGVFPNCDSIVTTILTVNTVAFTASNATICANDSIFLANTWQTTAGVYYDTISNGLCDSIVETTLSVDLFLTDTVDIQFCFGDIFVYVLPDGIVVNTVGTYNSTVTNIGTCDSLITTNISFSNAPITNTTNSCTNDVLAVGLLIDTLYTNNGCDSVYNNTNTFLITAVNSPAIITCTNDPAQVGTQIDTILSIGFCDSVYQQNTVVLIIPVYVSAAQSCTNTASQAGIDTILSISSTGGCDSVFSITETIFQATQTIALANDSICVGESATIFGVNQTNAGIFTNTISSSLGCDSIIESIELFVNTLPNINAGNDETITVGSSISLTAEGGDTYVWSTTENNETIFVSPIETSSYFVTGTDVNNCSNTDSVIVIVIVPGINILIPTAFSPNGDGVNDTFRIANEKYFEDINLRVYNRWGELVFQSDKNTSGWDGFYKNAPQELDTYIYYIDAKDKGTQEIVSVSGSFSLIR